LSREHGGVIGAVKAAAATKVMSSWALPLERQQIHNHRKNRTVGEILGAWIHTRAHDGMIVIAMASLPCSIQ